MSISGPKQNSSDYLRGKMGKKRICQDPQKHLKREWDDRSVVVHMPKEML